MTSLPKYFDIPKAPPEMEHAVRNFPLPEGIRWYYTDDVVPLLPEMKQVDPEALLLTAECVPTGRWFCYLIGPMNGLNGLIPTFGIELTKDSDIPVVLNDGVIKFQQKLQEKTNGLA